ncbi:probable RNA-binding protein 46 [Sipha flava]|uniref:Probable RNA-binding protein 46 n=1 Tax=Sipha flava TaxID=143950 RepID=A0A2S2QNP9_9HEMI|nr:probable RNA-binding protein 46 [Sipha flava]
MNMYCTPQNNNVLFCDYISPTPHYSLSSYSQSSYISSNSNYSQSSFSPPMSSPYTPSSQTSESFGNDNIFKFPPIIQDKYIRTREDLLAAVIAKANNLAEIEEIGQRLISIDKRHVIQNNGQKTLLPTVKQEPKRGSELYVALPKACLEGFLYAIFSQYGTVHQIRLMMHFSGSNRGYGYVMMSNPIEAEMVLVKLNELTLPGIRGHLLISMSTDNRTLFARNIPMDLSEEQLQVEFERRVEGVKKVRVFNHIDDPSKNREFCFVIFKDHRSAALARRSMAESPFFLNGVSIKIQWAESEPVFRYSVLKRMKQLHIRNMNSQTTEEDIWKLICQHVTPNNIVFIKKNNTCARIKFTRHEYADLVRKNLDGTRVHGINWIVMWDKIEGTKYERLCP